jgi:hypothetical protein
MKKLVSLMLALLLVVCVTISVSAETVKLKIGVLDRTADEEVHIKFGESIRAACQILYELLRRPFCPVHLSSALLSLH